MDDKIKKFFRLSKILKESFRGKKISFPTFSQWKQFFKILNKNEKIAFLIFLFLSFFSAGFLSLNFYFKNSEIQPAFGGNYIEGIVGQPRLINPIYASSSEIDQDLVELLFSGLMKYTSDGKIVPDLAKSYKIEDNGRVYEVNLKENLFWSDGEKFSADDVIFTVKTIQNQDYQSPLRPSFLGIDVEKISDYALRFRLKDPYPPFLETLTFKILPKHIWENIPPQNFSLAIYNLEPIGNGPFQLKNFNKDKFGYIKSLNLSPNPYYHGKPPFLSEISFIFFRNEEDLIKSWQKKELKGIADISPLKLEVFKKKGAKIYRFSFPRYFDISFNPLKSKVLGEKEVRLALNYGTDKEEIIREVLAGQGKAVYSPLLPGILNFQQPSKIYQFDLDKAKEILETAGWQDINQDGKREKIAQKEKEIPLKLDLKFGSEGNEVKKLQTCLAKDSDVYPEAKITGYFDRATKEAVIRFQEKYRDDILKPWGFQKGTGMVSKTTREKLNEICFEPSPENLSLKFSLVTVDQEELSKVADLLKKQWEKLGVDLEVKKVDLQTLQQNFLRPRNYEAILFGKVVGIIPDPLPFWHSSQKEDPGLNLAEYENKEADKILQAAKESLEEEKRKEEYQKFQEILIEDAPVVFLYSPDYLYLMSQKIKGIKEGIIADPSKRFIGVENWYIKERRVWK